MDSDSESEFSDQEAKEGQVQEVVSEDQEELVVDAGVENETLMEDTVLTSQRNNRIECDSEHSRSCSEARSEVDLLRSDAKEEGKKEEENRNDHMKDKEHHDENEKLVTGTDPEPNQTLQPKNVEVEYANMKAATESEIHLEGAEKLLFSDSLLKYLDKRKEKGKKNYKWDGSLQTLKDFVTLILKKDGQWRTKKSGGGKLMDYFTEKSSLFVLNFWPKSKTVTVQGKEDITKEILDKFDRLLIHTDDTKDSNEGISTEAKTVKKRQKNKTPKALEMDGDTCDAETKSEIKSMWTLIKDLKKAVETVTFAVAKNNMKLSTILKEKELKDSVNVVELDKDHTSSKYGNSRITDFFPKVEKSDVLIEDLQLRIKNLERERNHIKDQLNELKKWQSENGRGMCKVTPTQTKTSSATPKQNTEKGAQSKKQVGKKKETTQSSEQKNPTNSCASNKSTQPTKHQQQQQLPKDKVNQNGTHTKEKIFIAGDSMVKNLHEWMMSRTKTVKVHSFSGSTVQDMEYFVEPLLARYPDHIIIHVGINNLSDKSMTADRIADKIFQLANKIEERGIKYTISELITRRDENDEKARLVNKKLEERKSKTNIGLVKHDNNYVVTI